MEKKEGTDLIPCTLGMITRNSGKNLEAALAPFREFAEIIICDGYSEDDTVEIAKRYGAKIIHQDKKYLDKNNRILNYAAIRNQVLDASTYDWFLYFDSDEISRKEQVDEIREIVSSSITADSPLYYWMPRIFTRYGEVIERAINYPNFHPRLFHRSGATKFMKPIHERVYPLPGVREGRLKEYQYVPIDFDKQTAKKKWKRYEQMEIYLIPITSKKKAIKNLVQFTKTFIIFSLRLAVNRTLFFNKKQLPVWIETHKIVHRWGVLKGRLYNFFKEKKGSVLTSSYATEEERINFVIKRGLINQ